MMFIDYAAGCGCHFVILLIFATTVGVENKYNGEDNYEW